MSEEKTTNGADKGGEYMAKDDEVPKGRMIYEKALRDVKNSIGGHLIVSVEVAGTKWLRIRARDEQGNPYQVQFARDESAQPSNANVTPLNNETGQPKDHAGHKHHHNEDNGSDDECVDCSSGVCKVVQCPP